MINMNYMIQKMILAAHHKKTSEERHTHWLTPTANKDPHIRLRDPTSLNTPLTVTDIAQFI